MSPISHLRVDSDYSKRRLAQKYFGVVDPDYYEWESHILFDDSHKDTVWKSRSNCEICCVSRDTNNICVSQDTNDICVSQDTNEGKQKVVNDYVVLLCGLIDKAGSR